MTSLPLAVPREEEPLVFEHLPQLGVVENDFVFKWTLRAALHSPVPQILPAQLYVIL